MPKKTAPAGKKTKKASSSSSVNKKIGCEACGTNNVKTLEELLGHRQWCPAAKARKDAADKAKAALSSQKKKNR